MFTKKFGASQQTDGKSLRVVGVINGACTQESRTNKRKN